MPSPHRKPRLLIPICLLLPMLAGGQQVAPPHDRTHEQTIGDVRITTAVPSAIETQEIFGVKLYKNNVQPVWIQVENLSDRTLWFFPAGLDDAYYSPLETAARGFSWEAILDLDVEDGFQERKMGTSIPGGGIRSGYVFSRVDEGTKSFNVDVFAPGEDSYRMTFFVPVPGLRLDHYNIDFDALYDDDELTDVDLAGLVSALEDLPCCVKDKKGKSNGDPLNIVFIGDTESLYYAFLRAGWDETETVYGTSLAKMGLSSVVGGEYRYSPVSALYVFGRGQDAAFQRARSTINERNHLRVWLTPLRFEGKPVWIGQISRDIGVRFTTKTITTHKIDPNVDETREFLIEDLAYSQGLAKFGYVQGVGAAPYDAPRGNLTGDPYFTDGLRGVMWISDEPVSLNEIDVVDLGSHPPDEPM
jgi:hypothetical protein